MPEEGRRNPKRGIVLLDGDSTVRYRWQAEDNWDSWGMDPIADVADLLDELSKSDDS